MGALQDTKSNTYPVTIEPWNTYRSQTIKAHFVPFSVNVSVFFSQEERSPRRLS